MLLCGNKAATANGRKRILPVKMQSRTARRLSDFVLLKIIFPLKMRRANAAGILICYILIFCAARAMDASSATRRFSSIWPQ